MSRAMRIVSIRRQSGAALYVSLIVLILMTLIGLVAMQVAGLQERMSANYQASNLACQNAEAEARAKERGLEQDVLAGRVVDTDLPPNDCTTVHDAQNYSEDEAFVRRLDLCFSWTDLTYGKDESERTDQIFQVTAFAKDRPGILANSEAVVDTVFIP